MKSIFKLSLIFYLVLSLGVGSIFAAETGAEKSHGSVVTALSQGRIIDAEVDYMFRINDIDILENLSELIVKGRILSNSESVVKNPPKGGISGYTLTKVEIAEVFSGEASVGDIITLVEPYFEALLGDGKTYIITRSGYLPSIIEGEYILFLVKNQGSDPRRNGSYEMYNTIMGRYPVPKQTNIEGSAIISNQEMSLTEDTNTLDYREVFEDVLDKYNKKNKICALGPYST